jgi:hypothetical protein
LLLRPYIYKIHAMADGSRSSSFAGTRDNSLLHWLMPSVTDLIFVALLASLVFTPLSVKLLEDAGTGWHIRTGQFILETHTIPRVDPFSSQIQKPWIAWEWLYDVIVGRLEFSAGLNGVVWFTAVAIAIIFAGMFRLLVARGTSLLTALLLTLLAMSASTIHFLARPHVLSWWFVLVWYWILDSAESVVHDSDRRLWLLPPLMLIWVNVHGGFLLGFVLVGIFCVGSLWTWLSLKESRIEESLEKIAAGKRARQLTLVGLASAVGSLVNPYGWHLHAHIYSYLSNRFFIDHIDEFQSPNFHGIAQRCLLVLLLIVIAALAARGRRLRLSQILLTFFAVYAALYSSRNIPVSSILLAAIAGLLIPSLGTKGFVGRMVVVDSSLRGHLWPIVAIVATLIIALNGGRVGSTPLMDAHFDARRMPVDAVSFLEQSGLRGPVLAPDYWGGYLIYRLYPNTQVVIDDRHDFYGEAFLRSYLTMMHVEPGWYDFLKWRGSCLVLPKSAALSAILGETPEWKSVYSDDVAIVFVRSQNEADSDRAPDH